MHWWAVRVLLDESVPRQLVAKLSGHDVSTVQREGWSGLKNGALLKQAADRFYVVQQVALGRAEADAGNVIPQEQAVRELERRWILGAE